LFILTRSISLIDSTARLVFSPNEAVVAAFGESNILSPFLSRRQQPGLGISKPNEYDVRGKVRISVI